MKGGFHKRYRVAKYVLSQNQRQLLSTKKQTGFTIMEVLIVLGVTGALFISAVALISGRQNRTEFTIAINNVVTQIQQTISDVGTGFYPSANNIKCTINVATAAPQFTAGTDTQGTNSACTFMGKAIQFGVKNTDPEKFATYSLAGLRLKVDGADAANVTEANPKVMVLSTAVPTDPPTAMGVLQNGLQTGKVTYTQAGTTKDAVAIAFVSDLSQNSDGLVSGAQNVNVYPIQSPIGQVVPTIPSDTAAAINANLTTSQVNPDGGVTICFLSNTTDQAGIVTIGGSNQRQNAVILTIRNSRTCP